MVKHTINNLRSNGFILAHSLKMQQAHHGVEGMVVGAWGIHSQEEESNECCCSVTLPFFMIGLPKLLT